MTGTSPVDRGTLGSKIHALVRPRRPAGLPLSLAVSVANSHDIYVFKPLVMADPGNHIPARATPAQPAKLHSDKAYDQPHLRRRIRDRGSQSTSLAKASNQARNSASTAGSWNESWPGSPATARLNLRYERIAENLIAFRLHGAAHTCQKKLRKLTT